MIRNSEFQKFLETIMNQSSRNICDNQLTFLGEVGDRLLSGENIMIAWKQKQFLNVILTF